MVNASLTPTFVGAWVISSDGLFSATPTSPNSVETQRLPFWKPSCGSSWLSSQLLVRMPRPAPGGGVAGVVAPPPLLLPPPLLPPPLLPPLLPPPLFPSPAAVLADAT